MEILHFWLREALSNVARNRMMSVLAISTATISLFVLGAFYLCLSNLKAATHDQTQRLELVVLLDQNLSPLRRKQIYEAARIPQVAKLDIVLASAALKEMGRELQMPIDDLLKTNPLHDELRVKLKNGDDYFKVRDYLVKIEGVSGVQNSVSQEAAQSLLEFNHWLRIAALASLFLLGLGVLLIISNAIRLTLFARRREIRVMQLVGATPGFVRGPFLLEGLLYGGLGALGASVLLCLSYLPLARAQNAIVQQILPLPAAQILVSCVFWMLLAGLFFGLFGAFLSYGATAKSLRE